jgi:hypothetical protein
MDIKQLAKKPQLIQVDLDDKDIVAEYGEPIKFWMMDYVDISTYFEFFRSQGEGNGEQLNQLLRSIILNAEGQPVLAADEAFPIDISVAALTKINETLGKSKTKPLTQNSGAQPS